MKIFFKKHLFFALLFLTVSAGGLYVSGAGKRVVDFAGDAVMGDSITHTWVNKVSTLKANLASPVFIGTPTTSAPNDGDESNRLATTARVKANTANADTGAGSGDWQCSINESNNPICINPTCGDVCELYEVGLGTERFWYCTNIGYLGLYLTNILIPSSENDTINTSAAYTSPTCVE